MAINIISNKSFASAQRDIDRMESDLEDAEDLIVKGKPTKNARASAVSLAGLAEEDPIADELDGMIDDLSLEDDLILEEGDDEAGPADGSDVDAGGDTDAVQEALVALMDAFMLLVPSASTEQLGFLAAALGMGEDEAESFVSFAESVLRPEGDLLGDVTAGTDEDEDDEDDEDDGFGFNQKADAQEVPKDAEEDDWDEMDDADWDDEPAEVVAAVKQTPQDALEDDSFTLDAADLNALNDDVQLPVIVQATAEQEELKEEEQDDGEEDLGIDDQEDMKDDGEPEALSPEDKAAMTDDGEVGDEDTALV